MIQKYIFLALILFAQLHTQAQEQQDTVKLDGVIIKSTKTNNTQQKAPSSISLINKKTLNDFAIGSIEDLNARVPNLFIPEHGSKLTSPIYIRGIGSRINSQAVGLYYDGIPYFEMGTFNFELYDISKIEVLRGPQGTLYGRNTMGGLINIFSAPLVKERFSSIRTDYGNYNRLKTVIHHNQPLSKNLIMALDAAYSHSDGYFKNIYLNNSADSYDTYSGRLKLKYTPTKKLKINFVMNYEKNLENGYPYAIYDTTTQKASDVNYNQLSSYHRDLLSTGLLISYTGNKYILKSASSYQYLKDKQTIDQDFTPKDLFYVKQNRQHNTLVQEFTIKSKATAKIQWLGGLFGFSQLKNKDVNVYYGKDAVAAYHLPGSLTKYKHYKQPTEGAAAYFQASLPIQKFIITAGIRADYEKDILHYSYDKELKAKLTHVQDVDTFNTYYQILPKLSISYQVNPNITTYFSLSKGYKAGGFNSTFERNEDISFNPESSINYEIGFKSLFLDNKVSANMSLFYIDWRNQQVYQPVPSGRGAMLKNAGKTISQGVELSLRAIPSSQLQFWLNTGFNEVKFARYIKDEKTNYSGNNLPYIPQYTANLGLSYSINLRNKIFRIANISTDYQYIGKFYWNDANTAYQKSYGLLNATLTINTGKHFKLGVYGKNLFNTQYNSYYFEALRKSYVQLGNPMAISAFIKFYF